jgi:hypothetical protein
VCVQQVEEVATFGTVRDALSKLAERNLGIRKVGKPCLTFRVVEGDS